MYRRSQLCHLTALSISLFSIGLMSCSKDEGGGGAACTALDGYTASVTAAPSFATDIYPILSNTNYEAGIPNGTKTGPVVHKVGFNGKSINDAALVIHGPHGAYVLVVCSTGPGGAVGWETIARIASRVWQFETVRP